MSCKCLFIEGSSQTGKSSAILECIQPFIDVTGGFLSQRLIENGETKAFCLIPAQTAFSSIAEYHPEIPNIFLESISGKWEKNNDIFTNEGVKLLTNISGKQLIVMDEIGGMELLSDRFREKIYEVLAGSTACIGVIKSHKNKSLMQKNVELDQRYSVLYEKLYEYIKNVFDGTIIDSDGCDNILLKKSINTFISNSIKSTFV